MAEVEWFVGILRAGSDFGSHGDPYGFSLTVVREGNHAVLKGGQGDLSIGMTREIFRCLAAQGIESASWVRQNGKVEQIDLRRYREVE